MSPDTAGFVIAPSPMYPALLEHIHATEWQTYIRAAIDRSCIFVGVGHPNRKDGRGLYAIVRDAAAVPGAIEMAHGRAGEVGSRCTAWIVLAEGEVERVARETLAVIAPTEGRA